MFHILQILYRTSEEAAVIEWGHSAIISALDGAVAAFGPQTSQGVSFLFITYVIISCVFFVVVLMYYVSLIQYYIKGQL